MICCLSGGTKWFGEPHARIPDISTKMLTQVLRALERDGLARRKGYPVVPPKTEYSLTALGQRLHEPIAALCRWAVDHPENPRAIEACRRRRAGDQRGG